MKAILKQLKLAFYIMLAKIFYPKCPWLITWQPLSIQGYIFWQKIININGARHISWPVHFTSRVGGDVTVGNMTSPGYAPGTYINGINGVDFGDNVWMGPGIKIISANHDLENYERHLPAPRITIGNNVWLGANAILLPGVTVGNNTVIGAGTVVTKSLPANVIAAGNPAKIIRQRREQL